MTAPEPVTVERLGVVTHVNHRTTIHQQPWVILTVEHSGNIETAVLIFPDRIQLADGIGEGDRVRAQGALRYAEDPLVPPAIVAEQLTTVTYESHGGDVMSTNRIQKMIQKAHRDGQSVDDLLSEIDYDQVNTTNEDTADLVARLAADQGLGWSR